MAIYQLLNNWIEKGEHCVVVTVVEKSGEGPLEVGKKMAVGSRHQLIGTVGGGAIEYEAVELAKEILITRKSRLEKYVLNEGRIVKNATTLPMACGGMATLFFEYVGPKAEVLIFGGGHVGAALVKVLKSMDFYVTVIDHREDVMAMVEGADQKFIMNFVPYLEENPVAEHHYVIVSTPSHKYDFHVLNKILSHGILPKYLGLLCSKTKLKEYLAKTYETYGKDVDLGNFYAPVGLDTGGGSPAEIAVSIAAEILTVHYNKEGHNHMSRVKEFSI